MDIETTDSADNLDDLAALLEGDDVVIEDTPPLEMSDEELPDAVREAEIVAVREEIEDDAEAAIAARESEAVEKPAPKATRVKREPIDLRTMVAELSDQNAALFSDGGPADVKADVIEAVTNESAKKVIEKVVNYFKWRNGEAKLSVYTRIALEQLKSRERVSTAQLINAYENNPEKPYSKGTASAQTGQMMKLLHSLRIATRDGSVLVANTSHPAFNELGEA